MKYTVSQLAKLACITPRTLRHYDAVGLLRPSDKGRNGYRYYTDQDLLRLQQVLFYKELDFPLPDIKRILESPTFNAIESLRYQKRMISAKKRRLEKILTSIDKTITNMKNNIPTDQDIYGALSTEEIDSMKQEAKERWGHTDAYKESQKRVAQFTKDDWNSIQEATERNMKSLVALMQAGKQPTDSEVQAEIAQHHAGINQFYDCTMEIYRGLAEMYLADPRFKAFYEKYHKDLPEFLVAGMRAFADAHK